MNKPTLNDFLFFLNQDEDILVTIIDYKTDTLIIHALWKSDLNCFSDYLERADWFVQDFVLSRGGLEITIVESEKELD